MHIQKMDEGKQNSGKICYIYIYAVELFDYSDVYCVVGWLTCEWIKNEIPKKKNNNGLTMIC